ncbi:MAG: glutathione S-transferase family protein [Allosphingosinicella sp.]|uniref:glutathione S-transferase family protein n=1 Tax=Allosphingosinicella sp. TaxID=2823234 RepID=UPI003955DF53
MFVVLGDERSGNCLKVKWLLDHLGLAYEWRRVDILTGATREPEFLALNPAGQIPVLLLGDGRALAQSNAILLHLAEATPLVPADSYERAKMLEWMFWEQYSHEPYLAVRRFQRLYLGRSEEDLDPRLLERGERALAIMEATLERSDWLVAGRLTLADICLLPYTQLAPEGGFDLGRWPSVLHWIERVRERLGCGPSSPGLSMEPRR